MKRSTSFITLAYFMLILTLCGCAPLGGPHSYAQAQIDESLHEVDAANQAYSEAQDAYLAKLTEQAKKRSYASSLSK